MTDNELREMIEVHLGQAGVLGRIDPILEKNLIRDLVADIKQHTDRAVVEELEFAYKMATPEQKQALKDLYADRGVNKGLSFTPQANLQSKESKW